MLEGIQRTSEYSLNALKRMAQELARNYTPKGKLIACRLRVSNNGVTLVADVAVKGEEQPVQRTMAL